MIPQILRIKSIKLIVWTIGISGYDQDVNVDNHPCYESIALKEMYFGAGWDHKDGEKNRPRRICSVKRNKIAILTTVPPGKKEADRLVIGLLYIDEISDDPGEETKIQGDKEKSIALPFKKIKIRFWDYYKNPKAKKKIIWNSGLFRYVSNKTVINIIERIIEKYSYQYKENGKALTLLKEYAKIRK